MLSKKFSDAAVCSVMPVRKDYGDDGESVSEAAGGNKYRNSRRKSLQKRNREYEIIQRDLRQKDVRMRQRRVVMGAGGHRAGRAEDTYVDRDRAGCITYGKR